jgi:hypothetical protein
VREAIVRCEGVGLEIEDRGVELKGNLRVAFPDGRAYTEDVGVDGAFCYPVVIVVRYASTRYVTSKCLSSGVPGRFVLRRMNGKIDVIPVLEFTCS